MSAFYIKELSDGSEKYQRDFEYYKQASRISLEQYLNEGGGLGLNLLQKWKKFSGGLNVKYSNVFGLEVDPQVRRDFRDYLFEVYKMVEKNKSAYVTQKTQLLLARVQVEVIAARFFDISSTYDGPGSMFSGDSVNLPSKDLAKMNIKIISQNFKTSLFKLANASEDESVKHSLIAAISAWEFVEEEVVNYRDKSAYLVVYAIKNKIHKALDLSNTQHSAN